jgi:phosphohistidine swiveling domain-containing protein
LRELAVIRRALLAVDRTLHLDGLVFHLTLDEIARLKVGDIAALRAIASRRREQAASLYETPSLPAAVTVCDLEALSAGESVARYASGGLVQGTRVAGTQVLEARACVVSEDEVERGDDLVNFKDGDIIVAPMISPAWLPYFSRVGGFVSEVGGWLSHTAILAREYDVPMIVGANAIGRIVNGSLLRLHLYGRVEVLNEPQRIEKAVSN